MSVLDWYDIKERKLFPLADAWPIVSMDISRVMVSIRTAGAAAAALMGLELWAGLERTNNARHAAYVLRRSPLHTRRSHDVDWVDTLGYISSMKTR